MEHFDIRRPFKLAYAECRCETSYSFRKHAYSQLFKVSPSKTDNFQIKILTFFIFLLKIVDWGYSLKPPRRCGSNEYPQSMFEQK